MVKIKEIIVVEGRYDKNTVSQVVDGTIIETSGFGIFKNDEKVKLLKKLAEKRGIIVMTDSDGAGFLIRNFLKGNLQDSNIKHAYIPDVFGKERRKRNTSGEGKLGVEGMSSEVIIHALKVAGATFENQDSSFHQKEPITKADLYFANLSGTKDCTQRRLTLQKNLDLPEHLSTNGLLDVLNILFTREEFFSLTSSLHLPEEDFQFPR